MEVSRTIQALDAKYLGCSGELGFNDYNPKAPRVWQCKSDIKHQMLGKGSVSHLQFIRFLFLDKACIANRGLLVIDVNQWNTLKITKNIEAW